MNLAYLEYFNAAARDGSFARAAKRLFVAPQTVSTAVAALEREWGFSLFERKPSGIELTEQGAAMLEETVAVLHGVQALQEHARHMRDAAARTVTFAYASASLPDEGGLLSFADLEAFRALYPNIAVNTFELTSDACIDAVVDRRADAAFAAVESVPADIESAYVSPGSFLVGVSRDNPLSLREELSFADLKNTLIFAPPDLNLTYTRIVERCRAYGFEPQFSTIPFSIDNARNFIRENLGVSFTPKFFAEDIRFCEDLNATVLPLVAQDDFTLPLRLVWRKDAESTACAHMRDFMLERIGSAARKAQTPEQASRTPSSAR